MAVTKQNHSIIRGTLAELIIVSGDYVGQQGFANDYGVGEGLEYKWNGSSWYLAPRWQILKLQRTVANGPADTNENILFTYTLPKLGVNDMLRVEHFWTIAGTAVAKTVKVNLGASGAGTGLSVDLQNGTTNSTGNMITGIRNMGAANAQKWYSNNKAVFGLNSGSLQGTTRDTGTAGVVLTVTATKALGTETMNLEYCDLHVFGGGS